MTESLLATYSIHACLPFVEIADESKLNLGPVTFWPGSKFPHYTDKNSQQIFKEYLDSAAQIKTQNNKNQWLDTSFLSPEWMTFISISDSVPFEQKDALLIDSLYLLYFICTFRNLYYGNEIPSFDAFRKLIPATAEFINNKSNWNHNHIHEIQREETVCIHTLDHPICESFGKILNEIYTAQDSSEATEYKRIVRAIRYVVDRFYQRFVNLFDHGLEFPSSLFEPEDIIFLSAAFESLFDINDKHPGADFKYKLRPLLHLKYSIPVEFFWKWVDDFYEVKRKIVHGGLNPDPLFRLNQNFLISHISIGIKLFIYSVYTMLMKNNLLTPLKQSSEHTPPDFDWIHPEEIILFFWTENDLLNKLNLFLIKLVEEKTNQEELFADIHFLGTLFISMQNRYNKKKNHNEIKFIPSNLEEIKKDADNILLSLAKAKENQLDLSTILPKNFEQEIILRLQNPP